MGRTHVSPIVQNSEVDCGPASIKHVLAIFRKRKSLATLNALCKTTRNGTSTSNMIRALSKLGFAVLSMQNATLRHLIGSLRYPPANPRAVIVSYLYTSNAQDIDWKDSGHWATVSSYSASNGKIVLFDSYTGRKKSYRWSEFKELWKDYDLVRKVDSSNGQYTTRKKWQYRLLLVIARDASSLPAFTQRGVQVFMSDSSV